MRAWQQACAEGSGLTLPPHIISWFKPRLRLAAVTDDETLATIRSIYEMHKYVLDPHTAVGVAAAQREQRDASRGDTPGGRGSGNRPPQLCLACAHPLKFLEAVEGAMGWRRAESLEALRADIERQQCVAATSALARVARPGYGEGGCPSACRALLRRESIGEWTAQLRREIDEIYLEGGGHRGVISSFI